MTKKNSPVTSRPSTLRAAGQKLDGAQQDEHVVVVADTPKTAFEITYTMTQRGHNPECRDVVVAAEKMSDAVAYIEGQGGVVQRASAVLGGAQFINL